MRFFKYLIEPINIGVGDADQDASRSITVTAKTRTKARKKLIRYLSNSYETRLKRDTKDGTIYRLETNNGYLRITLITS